VQARDARMAGLFIYAVRSTGVYCRPGCGARRPLERNVEFFSTPAQADAAGYRACRRCRPDQTQATDPAVQAVITLCRWLEGPQGNQNVSAIASTLGYGERHLRRRFSEVVGVPIGTYLRAQQAERARTALQSGMMVTDAVFEAGYGSTRAFYEHGATRLGMTPGRYRDGGRGERIRYTSMITPIGVVLAASTARGVCAVQVGPDEPELVSRLAAEFPHAIIERDDEGLAHVAVLLAGAVRGEQDPTVLPLDLEGTAFQIRVWEALRTIPVGSTRSYSQVALQIGSPTAVRAVAGACGANPAALVIPCHRVVRQDGSLGGYRWGIAAKQALLAVEAVSLSL
jgi:AraC family transcriptional regulator of adaptative response/methylated-DNA-[protein]-cysteine methyltransferase